MTQTSSKAPSIVRIYALSTLVSIALVGFVGARLGIGALVLVLVLIALEITFSVDNAVVNARILERMSNAWQQAFLTVGIVIAVFGVRVLLPILIVVVATGTGFSEIVNLALNDPDAYGDLLHDASPMIAAFGGVFLLMLFFDFFFQRRRTKWLVGLETVLQSAGKLESLSVILVLGILLILSTLVEPSQQLEVIASGAVGLVLYLAINSLDTFLTKSAVATNLRSTAQVTFKAGLIGFIYLNIIDASFSLDGVIGAFAITDRILLIAVGLGIGALYVRVITIHMLRRKVLQKYKYLEHGAHYAIGILAGLMLASLVIHVSEFVAGLAGITFVITSIIHSYFEAKSHHNSKVA